MKHVTRSGTFLLALTTALFVTPQAVGATPYSDAATTSVSVQVTDLNLASPDGIDVLYQRLSAASRQICGNTSDLKIVGSLKQLRLNKSCFDSTMAQALAEANFPSTAQLIEN